MDWTLLLLLAAMVVLFWLMIIRPSQQRQKAVAELQGSLAVGDEVMMSSGVFGTIVSLADDHAMLEVAPGVTIKVARGAIAVVNRDQSASEPDSDGPTDESDDKER